MKKPNQSSLSDCPCCSGYKFADCCKPMLVDCALADTPERLMRSRYSAFATHDHDYLLRTWHKHSRPRSIKIDSGTIWLNLEITQAILPSPEESIAHVTYIALFIQAGELHEIEETSSFILEKGRWYYSNGDVIVQTYKIALNSKCPCGTGKKYKRCCHQ